eukprot:758524-Hanusia_phi.AAC.7
MKVSREIERNSGNLEGSKTYQACPASHRTQEKIGSLFKSLQLMSIRLEVCICQCRCPKLFLHRRKVKDKVGSAGHWGY